MTRVPDEKRSSTGPKGVQGEQGLQVAFKAFFSSKFDVMNHGIAGTSRTTWTKGRDGAGCQLYFHELFFHFQSKIKS